jgi:hypothetical protein
VVELAPYLRAYARAYIASIVFGLISVLHTKASESENGLFITIAFLTGTFILKALQKFAENRFPAKR